MGNSMNRRRDSWESQYTKSTGLYDACEWDEKTVRKLIIDRKLAPRVVGQDEKSDSLDECPICFLNYPFGLNRSKCCGQQICTECFLQVVKPRSQKSACCPFCNRPKYATKYVGEKTQAEKEEEDREEQLVISARIRQRKEEEERDRQRAIEKEKIRQERIAKGLPPDPPSIASPQPPSISSSSSASPRSMSSPNVTPPRGGLGRGRPNRSMTSPYGGPRAGSLPPTQSQMAVPPFPPHSHQARRRTSLNSNNSNNSNNNNSGSYEELVRGQHNFFVQSYGPLVQTAITNDLDIDLEELMLMEAIRLSLEESGESPPVGATVSVGSGSETESEASGSPRRLQPSPLPPPLPNGQSGSRSGSPGNLPPPPHLQTSVAARARAAGKTRSPSPSYQAGTAVPSTAQPSTAAECELTLSSASASVTAQAEDDEAPKGSRRQPPTPRSCTPRSPPTPTEQLEMAAVASAGAGVSTKSADERMVEGSDVRDGAGEPSASTPTPPTPPSASGEAAMVEGKGKSPATPPSRPVPEPLNRHHFDDDSSSSASKSRNANEKAEGAQTSTPESECDAVTTVCDVASVLVEDEVDDREFTAEDSVETVEGEGRTIVTRSDVITAFPLSPPRTPSQQEVYPPESPLAPHFLSVVASEEDRAHGETGGEEDEVREEEEEGEELPEEEEGEELPEEEEGEVKEQRNETEHEGGCDPSEDVKNIDKVANETPFESPFDGADSVMADDVTAESERPSEAKEGRHGTDERTTGTATTTAVQPKGGGVLEDDGEENKEDEDDENKFNMSLSASYLAARQISEVDDLLNSRLHASSSESGGNLDASQ